MLWEVGYRQLELALVFAEAGLEREGSEQGELEETFEGKVADAVLRYMEVVGAVMEDPPAGMVDGNTASIGHEESCGGRCGSAR